MFGWKRSRRGQIFRDSGQWHFVITKVTDLFRDKRSTVWELEATRRHVHSPVMSYSATKREAKRAARDLERGVK